MLKREMGEIKKSFQTFPSAINKSAKLLKTSKEKNNNSDPMQHSKTSKSKKKKKGKKKKKEKKKVSTACITIPQ